MTGAIRMRNSLKRPSFYFYALMFAAFFFACATQASAQLIICEFRARGPNADNDEFIEIYHNSWADHTVTSCGASTVYAVAASVWLALCFTSYGTVVP